MVVLALEAQKGMGRLVSVGESIAAAAERVRAYLGITHYWNLD
jgi:hypothetical protein